MSTGYFPISSHTLYHSKFRTECITYGLDLNTSLDLAHSLCLGAGAGFVLLLVVFPYVDGDDAVYAGVHPRGIVGHLMLRFFVLIHL